MGREFVTLSLEERTYIPKDWIDSKGEPEANAFKVRFKPLNKRQLAAFIDNSSRLSINSNTIILGNAVNSIDVCKTALTGWENFIVDGEKVNFKKDSALLVEDSLLENIDLDIIEEIATHIVKVSRFPEIEKGK